MFDGTVHFSAGSNLNPIETKETKSASNFSDCLLRPIRNLRKSLARQSRVPATVLAPWGASWGVLGASWGRLGRVLGASWGRLGSLGASWARLGAVLRRLGDVLGRLSLPIQRESDF